MNYPKVAAVVLFCFRKAKPHINYTGLETAESALWCTNHATLKTAHTTRNQHVNILLHILQVCPPDASQRQYYEILARKFFWVYANGCIKFFTR